MHLKVGEPVSPSSIAIGIYPCLSAILSRPISCVVGGTANGCGTAFSALIWIVLLICVAIFAYNLIADRLTPYSSQATVQAYIGET